MNRPFAFVTFKNPEIIDALLEQKLYLHSRTIRMERTKSNSCLEIPNLTELFPYSLNVESKIEQFLTYFGPISQLSVFGYIASCNFSFKKDAFKALLFLRENQITAYLTKPKVHNLLWVGNLPLSTSVFDLEGLFSRSGNVINIQLSRSCKKNKINIQAHSPFAMITFRKSLDAHNAFVQLNGKEWNGSILRINIKESDTVYPTQDYYHPYPAISTCIYKEEKKSENFVGQKGIQSREE